MLDLHIDDAEVCPELKCHVKHVHLRIVKVRSKITYLTGSTQHEDHLVKNDHHVADVVAICVKTIRVGSSEYIFNI